MEMDGRPTPRQAAWDVARAIRACYVVSEWMVNTDGSQEIGSALSYYLDKGIVPADLHMGNIGMAQHEDYSNLTPAIIDPGVAIPVKIDWYDVTIPAELSVAA